MTEDFNSEIASIPTDLLEQLFDESTPGTPNANDIVIGKETVLDVNGEIPALTNTDDLFDDSDKTPEEIEAAKVEKEKTDNEAKLLKEKEEADKNKTPEQLAKEKEEAEKLALKTKEEEEAKANEPQIIEALTNTVDYLVKSGNWQDFEGREGLEVTPEIYQQLVVEQDKLRLNSQFDELVDSTGDYGKAIISHIKRGGNPDEIIDIFKEQKALESIDTSTEEGKALKIEKYYSDVLGWKPKKVESFIKDLVTNDKVDDEFADVSELYDKHYKQQLEAVQKEADEQDRIAAENREKFKLSIKTALEKEDTLTPQQRKQVESAILDFKHDIGGGQKVNDFYLKFAEMQKDPAQYIELVRFVMDPKNYKKAIAQVEGTKEAKKVFTFIKGNAAVKKTGTDTTTTSTKSGGGTKW